MSNAAEATLPHQQRILVVGAGAWGTTLAHVLANAGRQVTLLAHTREHADDIRTSRENTRYLPGVALSPNLQIEHDSAGLEAYGIVLLVVPAQRMRDALGDLPHHLVSEAILVSAAKGLELGSHLRMSEVITQVAQVAPERVCALSGPNLSREIAAELPASGAIAGCGDTAVATVQAALSTEFFRLYTSRDIIGVELGGALKNVIAIGAGVADGLNLGANAKAAFMTRGLAEIIRLGVAAGANPLTFGGLSGLGDLIATCESPLSRNRTYGERLAKGEVSASGGTGTLHVVEGLTTARATVELAARYGVDVPIAQAVVDVLDGQLSLPEAMQALMGRAWRAELDVG